ncbi:MAG: acyl-CoA dehydrogenase, partial [Actinomycetota bacterium]|nr:acyl-CoA dehydrogenase [Actinomycetota bacterium]
MRLGVSRTDDHNTIRAAAQAWVTTNVPEAWHAASAGGRAAIRAVRPRSDYEAWYPTFADSGMAVATWPVAYGGLDLTVEQAKAIEDVIGPLNLGRLNPLGLHNA